MKRLLTISVAFMFAAPQLAFADPIDITPPSVDSTSTSSADANSLANSTALSGTTSSNNSALGVNINETSITNVKQQKEAPSTTLVTPQPTSPCKDPIGLSGSVPGGGFGFNIPHSDKVCQLFAAGEPLRGDSVKVLQAKFMMKCMNYTKLSEAITELGMSCKEVALSISDTGEK